ncbi:site-specific DNA-methyltransferase [Pasteurella multocida]|uniref:site-specific DNA-methyltransferase n=1 Tax=Pasteurella multocida TaxID=747 RepID=UPI00111BBCC4|nr:site-specific DNA-methyltransferase [Pasteurella multocida]MDY0632887.1 site-specific DNA-methyltransferase [Pasteurella multocida]QDA13072.1 site-specific DNA-methyltransferase [Pasteurella multocida subsp. multocida]
MELSYKNKKSEKDVFELSKLKAKDISSIINKKPNLLLFGDNFTALSSLINSGYSGKIDLIYIDPPYNTNQVFTVSDDDRVSTISRSKSKSNIVAYNDNFTIEEYLEFMRERLFLMRELLSEKGSIYVHIDTKMGHYLKIILDEVFGMNNFRNDISRIKSNPKNFSRRAFGNEKDIVLFYVKNTSKNIFNNITQSLSEDEKISMFHKIDTSGRRYNTVPVHAPGETLNGETGREWKGMLPPKGRHWRVSPLELDKLDEQNLIEWSKNGVPRIKKFADEHKGKKIQDVWKFKDPAHPIYPTEKNASMLEMIIAQSSNENSIVMDCFAGSGSTLKVANKLGRKWIGVDISPVSLNTMITTMNTQNFELIELEKVSLYNEQ